MVGLAAGLRDQGGTSDVVLGAAGHAARSGGENSRGGTPRVASILVESKRKRSFLEPASFSAGE